MAGLRVRKDHATRQESLVRGGRALSPDPSICPGCRLAPGGNYCASEADGDKAIQIGSAA